MGLPVVVRVNKQMFTRKSVSIRPNGLARLTEVDSLEWSDEVAKELVPGMNDGGAPLGQAHGNYSCAASISVYLDACDKFETIIMALDPIATAQGNLAAAVFQLPIITREELRVSTALLVDCTIAAGAISVGNDGSALVRQYTIQPTYIIENGRSKINLLPAV
ncbi:hypothetical protein AKJ09_09855 [Labilithrix luteola]|uniref:Uncharacterized protein n=1 Tax=Labilithrix luteola TaxID=1391654 RepID=A0A0K1QBZ4_9BACT|nr:hypothetical protein [Labilithrix luteola]AKV03192.1 hypothetical protein AKJ09_09855 [Labilithrix luteola]